MHQCEVWLRVEVACLDEKLPIVAIMRLCLVVDGEWAENGGYRGDGSWIAVFQLKVHLFPVKELQVRNLKSQIIFINFHPF